MNNPNIQKKQSSKVWSRCRLNSNSTPEISEIQKPIGKCLLLNASRDDIVAAIKMKEHMDIEVQWFETHTAVHTGTVVGQSTLDIIKGDVRGLHPVQGALCIQNEETIQHKSSFFKYKKSESLILRNTVINMYWLYIISILL